MDGHLGIKRMWVKVTRRSLTSSFMVLISRVWFPLAVRIFRGSSSGLCFLSLSLFINRKSDYSAWGSNNQPSHPVLRTWVTKTNTPTPPTPDVSGQRDYGERFIWRWSEVCVNPWSSLKRVSVNRRKSSCPCEHTPIQSSALYTRSQKSV